MDFINNQYEYIKKGLKNMHKERFVQRKGIENLEKKVQDLQLKSRSSCVEMRNVPCADKETTAVIIKTSSVGTVVGTTIYPSDLRDIYRIPGKPGSTRPVVAEFQTV